MPDERELPLAGGRPQDLVALRAARVFPHASVTDVPEAGISTAGAAGGVASNLKDDDAGALRFPAASRQVPDTFASAVSGFA